MIFRLGRPRVRADTFAVAHLQHTAEQEAVTMDPTKVRALTKQLRRVDLELQNLRDELDEMKAELKKAAKGKDTPPVGDDEGEGKGDDEE